MTTRWQCVWRWMQRIIPRHYSLTETLTVEYVQDAVEKTLIEQGHAKNGKGIYLVPQGAFVSCEMNTDS